MSEFRILGPVEVLQHGLPVPLGPRRQRLVLVRLILDAGHAVSADRLIEDVWGGDPPDGALRTLRSYLSRLRAALGAGVIATHPGGYVLDADAGSIDAARFESLVAEGRDLVRRHNARAGGRRLREALSMWRGAPLADLPAEPFVVAEASRLEEQRLGAIEEKIEADLILGRHAELVAELESLLDEHPLRERLWGQLMTALYRAGRQADALDAYRRARAVLADELGLEPGAELRRLQGAVLRHELAPPELEPPHNLPTPLTRFIGRTQVVADVVDRLEHNRLVTLTGIGGSGKTRIAIEAARQILNRFPDGVWMVDLAPLSDPVLLPQTVAAAVGVEADAGGARAALLTEHLARSTALLLLDNCEHLGDDCAILVRRLLEASPHLRVLATSRESLAVAGEVTYEVPPLPIADGDAAEDDARASDAVRLFLDRAAGPVDADAVSAITRICRELDGLPLAIEIAAAQTRWLSPNEIAARVADRFRLLAYWSRSAPPRHRTLRASLDWSYERLEPDERELFHRLGVFAGGFTLAAAEAIADLDARTFDVLRRLIDRSLVLPEPHAAISRFRLLETVRQYALERSAAVGDTGETSRRHALFFAALTDKALAAIDTPHQARVHAELDADHSNIRAALEWAFAFGEGDLVANIARGMAAYWRLRGYLDEADIWLRRAIDLSTGAPAEIRGDLLGSLGSIDLRRNRLGDARERLAQAIELLRTTPGSGQIARWYQQLAYSWTVQGEFARGRAVIDEALELALSRGDTAAASHHVGLLAEIALADGRLDEAGELFERALALVERASPAHLSAYLESTARLSVARDELDEAARRSEEGLAYARDLGDLLHIGLNLMILAFLDLRRGDPARATQRLTEAVELLWLGENWASAGIFDVLGALLLDCGQATSAATAFGVADALRRRVGTRPGLVRHVLYRQEVAALHEVLGGEEYARWRAAGVEMTPHDALEFARFCLLHTVEVEGPRTRA